MGKQEVDGQMSRQKVDSNAEAEKKIPSVGLVNEIWDKRRKSNLVKWLMAKSNVSMEEMADYLDCSKQYLNNKFSRDCFSMEDTSPAHSPCPMRFIRGKPGRATSYHHTAPRLP